MKNQIMDRGLGIEDLYGRGRGCVFLKPFCPYQYIVIHIKIVFVRSSRSSVEAGFTLAT